MSPLIGAGPAAGAANLPAGVHGLVLLLIVAAVAVYVYSLINEGHRHDDD